MILEVTIYRDHGVVVSKSKDGHTQFFSWNLKHYNCSCLEQKPCSHLKELLKVLESFENKDGEFLENYRAYYKKDIILIRRVRF